MYIRLMSEIGIQFIINMFPFLILSSIIAPLSIDGCAGLLTRAIATCIRLPSCFYNLVIYRSGHKAGRLETDFCAQNFRGCVIALWQLWLSYEHV